MDDFGVNIYSGSKITGTSIACFWLFPWNWQNRIINGFTFTQDVKFELEGNCDFSTNNNVWTKFYEFLRGHFEFY